MKTFSHYRCDECGATFKDTDPDVKAPQSRYDDPECPRCMCDDMIKRVYKYTDNQATPITLQPTLKASWRKDPQGYYKIFIRGIELPEGTQAEVESRSGAITLVTLTGTHSQISGGYLYWYKKITETVMACDPPPVVNSFEEEIPEMTIEELNAALGL